MRPWTNITFTVTSDSPTAKSLQRFLNDEYEVNPPTAIPAADIGGYLQRGLFYLITCELCNFLGACGQATVGISVVEASVPSLSILGPQRLTVTRPAQLELTSSTFISSCDGLSTGYDLNYTWALLDASARADVSMVLSKSSSQLLLPPYSLSVGHTYTAVVTVRDIAGSMQWASSSVYIFVKPSKLVALILGGDVQSIHFNSNHSMVATTSYDPDQPGYGNVGLQYKWTCSNANTTASALMPTKPCPIEGFADFASYSILPTFISSHSSDSSDRLTISLTLTAFDSSRMASAVAVLKVVGYDAPMIQIFQPRFSTGAAFSGHLYLEAKIRTPKICSATWKCDDARFEFSGAALTPLTALIPPSASSLDLLLKPFALRREPAMTFSIECAVLGSTVSTFSSITIQMNIPPTPGTFHVNPAAGEGHVTQYSFVAAQWQGQVLPLFYEFGFVSQAMYYVLQLRSQASYAVSALPAGDVISNYSLPCVAQVVDLFGANASAGARVVVRQTDNQAPVDQMLTTLNGTSMTNFQIISLATASLNRLTNCSQAPNCTALHRSLCSSTPHTCGECTVNFYGSLGHDNTACVSTADVLRTITVKKSCRSETNCNALQRCSAFVCVPLSKTCPRNCSSIGRCVFGSSASLSSSLDCKVTDPSCTATCVCPVGRNGQDCSLTDAELATRQEQRELLLTSLENVISISNLNVQAISAWGGTLAALVSQQGEISPVASGSAVAVAEAIVSAAISGNAPSWTLNSIFVTVDSLMQVRGVVAEQRRHLLSKPSPATDSKATTSRHLVPNAEGIKGIIDSVASWIGGSMLPLQVPFNTFGSSYRLTSVPGAPVTSMTSISIPKTVYESLLNTTTDGVAFPANMTSNASLHSNMISPTTESFVKSNFTNARFNSG